MSGETADQDATLESLAESVAEVQSQLAVVVEWLESIEERLEQRD